MGDEKSPVCSQAETWAKFSSSRKPRFRSFGILPGSDRRRTLAVERVDAHKLRELEEIGDAARALERQVQPFAVSREVQIGVKLFAQRGNFMERALERCLAP